MMRDEVFEGDRLWFIDEETRREWEAMGTPAAAPEATPEPAAPRQKGLQTKRQQRARAAARRARKARKRR